jgi:hypothetical protein
MEIYNGIGFSGDASVPSLTELRRMFLIGVFLFR